MNEKVTKLEETKRELETALETVRKKDNEIDDLKSKCEECLQKLQECRNKIKEDESGRLHCLSQTFHVSATAYNCCCFLLTFSSEQG